MFPAHERDDELTRDLLLLVDKKISIEVIAALTDQEISEIENWVSAVYLDASDNEGIKIPEYPEILKEIEQAGARDCSDKAPRNP